MNGLRIAAISLLSGAILVASGSAPAQAYGTPDGETPAQEDVCDDAGLMGAAFGLCIAFCEANDCDLYPRDPACQVLRARFARATGSLAFPCEIIEESEE